VQHQTWSATGFLRIVLTVVAGIRLAPDGVRFEPLLPPGLDELQLTGLPYRAQTIDLHVARGAAADRDESFLPATGVGRHQVELTVA